jgi:hypothetical protein
MVYKIAEAAGNVIPMKKQGKGKAVAVHTMTA